MSPPIRTQKRKSPLIDGGAWHEITLDVRKARESYEHRQHLARFQFFTNWREDAGQQFWYDDFAVSGE